MRPSSSSSVNVVSVTGASIPAATVEAAAAVSPTTTTTSSPAAVSRQAEERPISPPPTTTTSALEGTGASEGGEGACCQSRKVGRGRPRPPAAAYASTSGPAL